MEFLDNLFLTVMATIEVLKTFWPVFMILIGGLLLDWINSSLEGAL